MLFNFHCVCSVVDAAEHETLRTRAKELRQLLDHLILDLKLDSEICILELESLGRRHVIYLHGDSTTTDVKRRSPLPGVKPTWKYFISAFTDEINATLYGNHDVEERGMQLLRYSALKWQNNLTYACWGLRKEGRNEHP